MGENLTNFLKTLILKTLQEVTKPNLSPQLLSPPQNSPEIPIKIKRPVGRPRKSPIVSPNTGNPAPVQKPNPPLQPKTELQQSPLLNNNIQLGSIKLPAPRVPSTPTKKTETSSRYIWCLKCNGTTMQSITIMGDKHENAKCSICGAEREITWNPKIKAIEVKQIPITIIATTNDGSVK
jgi:transcription elongation factor Elf1